MQDYERELLQKALEDIVADIRERLEVTGTNASGYTSKSLEVVIRDDGGEIRGRQAFHTVETGREPGKVPQNFTKIIRQWMRDKGITAPPIPYKRQPSEKWQPKYSPEERGAMAMAGSIAYTIKTRGSYLFRHGGRKDIYTEVLDARLAELSEKLNIEILKRL